MKIDFKLIYCKVVDLFSKWRNTSSNLKELTLFVNLHPLIVFIEGNSPKYIVSYFKHIYTIIYYDLINFHINFGNSDFIFLFLVIFIVYTFEVSRPFFIALLTILTLSFVANSIEVSHFFNMYLLWVGHTVFLSISISFLVLLWKRN